MDLCVVENMKCGLRRWRGGRENELGPKNSNGMKLKVFFFEQKKEREREKKILRSLKL